jgi:hypothetical protein
VRQAEQDACRLPAFRFTSSPNWPEMIMPEGRSRKEAIINTFKKWNLHLAPRKALGCLETGTIAEVVLRDDLRDAINGKDEAIKRDRSRTFWSDGVNLIINSGFQ